MNVVVLLANWEEEAPEDWAALDPEVEAEAPTEAASTVPVID